MANEDGSVKLKVKLEMQAQQLQSMFDKIKSTGQSAFEHIKSAANNAYGSMSQEGKNTANAIKHAFTFKGIRDYFQQTKKLSDGLGETVKKQSKGSQEFQENLKPRQDIIDAYDKLNALLYTQKKYQEQGIGLGNPKYDENVQAIHHYKNVLADYQKSLTSAEDAERKMKRSVANTDPYAALQKRLQGLTSLFRQIKSLAHDASKKVQSLAGSLVRLASSMKSPKAFIGSFMPKLPGMLNQTSRSASGANFSFKKLATTLLKYGIGVRSFYFLFRKLRTALGQGIKALAAYDDRTNQSISNLLTSLNTLKGTFASAFSPIINVVAPILTNFCNLLATAVNYMGMFFAYLTGQKTYMKAAGVQQNFAGALNDTADAAGNAADAMKDYLDYLSGLDEIRKFESPKDTGSGSGGSGGGGGGSGQAQEITFEEVEIPDSIKNLVDRLKKFIADEDWEGLGAFIASGMNKALQKLYDVLDWDKIGPKVTYWIDAFTKTFNSWVDSFDWDLLGRVLGRGLNDAVNIANEFLEGVKWKNLGKKFATGVNGFLNEVNWENLGHMLGNKIMALWDTFNGFVHELDWNVLGKSISSAINGFFERWDATTIADSISTFLNGLFDTLRELAININWGEIGQNIVNGIATFIQNFHWIENGRSIEMFLDSFLGTIVSMVRQTDWEELGRNIGEFLSQIDWAQHLLQVAEIFWDVLSGLIKGLWSTSAGKALVIFIAGWFTATRLLPIANAIVKAFTSQSIVQLLAGGLSKLLSASAGSSAVLQAAGMAGGSVASAILAPLILGTISGIAQLIEIWHRVVEPVNNTRDILEQAAQRMGMTAEELGQKIVAEAHATGQSVQDVGKKYGVGLVDIYSASGEDLVNTAETITAEVGDTVEQTVNEAMARTQEAFDTQGAELVETAGGVGRKTAFEYFMKYDEYFGTESQHSKESSNDYFADVLSDLDGIAEKKGQSAAETGVKTFTKEWDTTLDKTRNSGDIEKPLKKSLEVDTKDVAATVASAHAKSLESGLETSTNAAKESFSRAIRGTFNIDTSKEAEKTAKLGTDTLIKTTESQTKNNTNRYKQQGVSLMNSINTGIRSQDGTLKSTITSLMNSMLGTIGGYSARFLSAATTLAHQLNNGLGHINIQPIINSVNQIIHAVSNMQYVMYNAGQNLAVALRNGLLSVSIPLPHMYVSSFSTNRVGTSTTFIPNYSLAWYKSGGLATGASVVGIGEAGNEAILPLENRRSMAMIADAIVNGLGNKIASLSRFGIPRLAAGAVIPANKEFLATLGDQRHGNNLETPEALLRKIVREESGNASGGNYRFTAQINRRTLFDELIQEAKLRRMQSGRNPFEMA